RPGIWTICENCTKMSLYPTLEDLTVDKVIQAQIAFYSNPANLAILSEAFAPIPQDGSLYPRLYPELSEYMGLSLNEEGVHKNLPMVAGTQSQGQPVMRPSAVNYMVAPVTGNDVGIRRVEIKQGIHEIIVCKDQDGKIGLHLKSIDNGIFVLLGFFSPEVLCSVQRFLAIYGNDQESSYFTPGAPPPAGPLQASQYRSYQARCITLIRTVTIPTAPSATKEERGRIRAPAVIIERQVKKRFLSFSFTSVVWGS
uniref:Uncharacterized protein n=1 Tax=Chelonoidis abingdonii TaxID=106734 RepID=A0A8C0HGI3_CHEAB